MEGAVRLKCRLEWRRGG